MIQKNILMIVGSLITIIAYSCQTKSIINCPSSDYSSECITYFFEVALNYPLMDTARLVKWNQNIQVAIHGNPFPADTENLHQIITELNDLLENSNIQLQLEEKEANMHLFFVSPLAFQQYEPFFKDVDNPILNGITFVYPTSNYEILQANILISSLQKDPQKRAHTLREEITQSLGLLTDSWTYSNSIFYEGQSYSNNFTSIDEQLIQLLYSSHIKAGQTVEEVLAILCRNQSIR